LTNLDTIMLQPYETFGQRERGLGVICFGH